MWHDLLPFKLRAQSRPKWKIEINFAFPWLKTRWWNFLCRNRKIKLIPFLIRLNLISLYLREKKKEKPGRKKLWLSARVSPFSRVSLKCLLINNGHIVLKCGYFASFRFPGRRRTSMCILNESRIDMVRNSVTNKQNVVCGRNFH